MERERNRERQRKGKEEVLVEWKKSERMTNERSMK